jgi:hypothetical protein
MMLLAIVAFGFSGLCPDVLAAEPTGAPTQTPATLRMVNRLRTIAQRADPTRNTFLSRERAQSIGPYLRGNTNLATLAQMGPMFAGELLQSGRSEDAMKQFRLLQSFFTRYPQLGPPRAGKGMQLGEAASALRLGEQENCIANHSAESCLFPLRPGGFHQLPRGSRTAIPILTNLLTAEPDDLRAQWLLNLAHMTLGEWPGKVPAEWLIGPEVFASEAPFPEFPEVAGRLGLDVDALGGGTAIEDFDNDGLLDVMLSSWSLTGQLRYFHNDGAGGFTERTRDARLLGLWGGLNLTTTDYNNDGLTDVLVLRGAWLGAAGHHPNSLLRNNGDGTFDDVTEEAGLLSFHPTQTAAWFDFDNDGWLDVFIGNETQNPHDPHPCELYRNNRNGTFTECAAANGLAVVSFVKAVGAGDYDGDGRPDLYLSTRNGGGRLFRNEGSADAGATNGAWRFRETTKEAGVAGPEFSFPTWFFDYDQDSRPDIFVAGYLITSVADILADNLGKPSKGTRAKLYRNLGDGRFEDVTKAAGLDRVLHAMGSNFGDLDNDGYPDFYLGTGDPDMLTLIPNRLFLNAAGKRFHDVTTAAHMGHLQKGHACAFADLDNDGDQDVFINMGGAFSGDNYRDALFMNPGSTNRWLMLKLEGRKSNRAAIGARIKVNVTDAKGTRAVYKWINTGGSFGANPLRAEIGLGDARAVESVEILWPASPTPQVVRGLEPNQFYRVIEGEDAAKPFSAKRVTFDLEKHHPHQATVDTGG